MCQLGQVGRQGSLSPMKVRHSSRLRLRPALSQSCSKGHFGSAGQSFSLIVTDGQKRLAVVGEVGLDEGRAVLKAGYCPSRSSVSIMRAVPSSLEVTRNRLSGLNSMCVTALAC